MCVGVCSLKGQFSLHVTQPSDTLYCINHIPVCHFDHAYPDLLPETILSVLIWSNSLLGWYPWFLSSHYVNGPKRKTWPINESACKVSTYKWRRV